MKDVRPPAVAGTFYPAEPLRLRRMVAGFLQTAVSTPTPKALIAPHAGYPYSGPIAGSAYAPLRDQMAAITTVILFGPAHTLAIEGVATVSYTAFETPLGQVPVQQEIVNTLCHFPQVTTVNQAHAREHGLEVQLPFLQTLFSHFAIVPVVVGRCQGEEVAELLQAVWGGRETLVVISSDLSHFYDYDTARQLDQTTAQAIVSLQPQNIGIKQACGRLPIQGLLHIAKQQGLTAELVDLRNSGDTAGSRDRVVGYGAFLFF